MLLNVKCCPITSLMMWTDAEGLRITLIIGSQSHIKVQGALRHCDYDWMMPGCILLILKCKYL